MKLVILTNFCLAYYVVLNCYKTWSFLGLEYGGFKARGVKHWGQGTKCWLFIEPVSPGEISMANFTLLVVQQVSKLAKSQLVTESF